MITLVHAVIHREFW